MGNGRRITGPAKQNAPRATTPFLDINGSDRLLVEKSLVVKLKKPWNFLAEFNSDSTPSLAAQHEKGENLELAERGGFEPPVRLLTVQRFSKPPPSATRPPLPRWSG